jgi:hypothetical protein
MIGGTGFPLWYSPGAPLRSATRQPLFTSDLPSAMQQQKATIAEKRQIEKRQAKFSKIDITTLPAENNAQSSYIIFSNAPTGTV